jgi:hypothetical protein
VNKFLHHSIVVYLALIVMLRMMAMPLSLLDYSMNQRFIADNLCENRLRPDVHCAGTCYLNKQLAKSSETTDSGSQKSSVKTVVTDYFEPVDRPSFSCMLETTHSVHVFKTPSLICQFTGNIFHPPIA